MSKVTAPLIAFDAFGKWADTIVFDRRRGTNVAVAYSKPSGAPTAKQIEVRAVFAFLRYLWKVGDARLQDSWLSNAFNKPTTGPALFLGVNVRTLNNQLDLATLQMSLPYLGGIPPAALVITGTAGQFRAALTVPTLPTGWTINRQRLLVMREQIPHLPLIAPPQTTNKLASPYSVAITGLTTGQLYRGWSYFLYNRPDGSIAQGAALTGTRVIT